MKSVSLGVIPGGTGNSLIISLLGEKRGFDPCFAALQVIKGKRNSLSSFLKLNGAFFCRKITGNGFMLCHL